MKDFTAQRARTIDAWCKIGATVGIVIGGLLGLSNYLSSRDHELYLRQAEASKPALQERLQLCVDLTTASGKTAVASDPKEQALAKKEFEQIYWGPFGLVEDGKVEQAAEDFDTCLQNTSKCNTNIQLLSRRLSLMCRASLGPNWGFPEFPPSAPTNLRSQQQ